jgi:hypothetical protein
VPDAVLASPLDDGRFRSAPAGAVVAAGIYAPLPAHSTHCRSTDDEPRSVQLERLSDGARQGARLHPREL